MSEHAARKQALVLERTYMLLLRLGRWPTWDELDAELDRGVGIDEPWELVRRIDRSLVWGLGHTEPADTQTISLTVAGLRQVPAAAEDLRLYTDTITWAVAAGRTAPAGTDIVVTPQVIVANIAVPAAGRADLLRRQHALWHGLGVLLSSGAGDGEADDWSVRLNRKQLRRLRKARTATELLDLLVPGSDASPSTDEPAGDPPASPGAAQGHPVAQTAAQNAGQTAGQAPNVTLDESLTEVIVTGDGATYEVNYAKVLGHGAQGRVYAGTASDGTRVAVKIVDLRTRAGTDPWYRDNRHAEREILIGAYAVANHIQGVVPLLGHRVDLDRMALVFSRAEHSLEDLISLHRHDTAAVPSGEIAGRDGGADGVVLDAVQVRRIASELADALAQLHLNAVMHRDIKPSNALFYNGRWCWADLGISRRLDQGTASYTFSLGGARRYASPEVFARTGETVRSDVYSLGCTIYELATGNPPFPTNRERQLGDLVDLDAVTDPDLRGILTYALAHPPGSRPTADDIASRLRRTVITHGAGATAGAPPDTPGHLAFKAYAERGRRAEDDMHAEGERALLRAEHSRDAHVQFRQIWDDFIAAAHAIDPETRGNHEDDTRSSLRLYDHQMYALRMEPAHETCPAPAVGLISMQPIHTTRSRPVATVYAELHRNDDDATVSVWKIVSLQKNYIHAGKPQRAQEPPVLTVVELERWLTARAAQGGPPEFVVLAEENLTVDALLRLFSTEATATASQTGPT